ncbi:MAG: hypothetical protein HUK20_00610 [Fibrobacter sp.]|nr:hypothetical protein [Fibrobacter sp.]
MILSKRLKNTLLLVLVLTVLSSAIELPQTFDEAVAARIDSLAPLRMNLPSVRERLENSSGTFSPVYGKVIHIQTLSEAREQPEYSWYFAESNLSPFPENSNTVGNTLITRYSPIEDELFVKWAYAYLQRQENLGVQKIYPVTRLYWSLRLVQATISMEKIYDSKTKDWVEPSSDSTTTLILFALNGPFYHTEKEGKPQVWNHSFFIPYDGKNRFFFNNGFSQASEFSASSLDSLKVLPYKYAINVPIQEIFAARKEISRILDNRDYAALPAAMENAKEALHEKQFSIGLKPEHTSYLKFIAGDFSELQNAKSNNKEPRSTPLYSGIYFNDSLNSKIDDAFHIYLSSPQLEKNIAKEKSALNRALAKIKVMEYTHKGSHRDRQNEVSSIVEAYLDSVDNMEQKRILAPYWYREEIHPWYIYFSFQAVANHFLGRLNNIAEPGKGFGVAFGFGGDKISIDFSLAGFWADLKKDAVKSPYLKDKNWKDYDFGMLDIGIAYTYKWLVTKRFEGGIYGGPTLNMTEITNKKIDPDLPDDVNIPNREWCLGFDLGLSFSLFEAFTQKDVDRMSTPTLYRGGRFGGKLKLGVSTQYAKETFDIFGWKAYAALELTLRAHFDKRPATLQIE